MIALAALLLADRIVSYVGPSSTLSSLSAFKGIVSFVLMVLAASYLKEAKE